MTAKAKSIAHALHRFLCQDKGARYTKNIRKNKKMLFGIIGAHCYMPVQVVRWHIRYLIFFVCVESRTQEGECYQCLQSRLDFLNAANIQDLSGIPT